MGEFPKIKSRRTIDISPWMKVIEREVAYKDGTTELYHAVGQQDYIAIVALTPDGRIPVVRQYRPALERHTWELPAGLVDEGEDPARTCERELLEETGHSSKAVHALGVFAPCTARLSNRVHSFFVEAGPRAPGAAVEAGIELNLVSSAELAAMIYSGEFTLQLHIGALMLAGMRGFIDLTAFTAR
ncbi:MAG TPA: NUDIX hydrolase [Pseudolabrys sp.]|nr:NUDIX hydrolase [Pseudolabrys sp.]